MDNQADTPKKEEGEDGYVFTREEIKKRPINKHKLARNTLLAAISAVVFGLVACITFALLSPFVMARLNKDEETRPPVNTISFTEDTVEDEMSPEDMIVSHPEPEIDYSKFELLEEEQIREILASVKYSVSDYQDLYRSLAGIASEAQKFLVRVTPVKQSTDWFSNITPSTSELSGFIAADNGTDYFILTYDNKLTDADSILVTFSNGVSVEADYIKKDKNTGLCVLMVAGDRINEVTANYISVAALGTSGLMSQVGSPVIAVGSPAGTYGSINYGIVTSNSKHINVTDYYYKHLTTDVYGSQNATGVFINLRGEVIGVIDTKFISGDTKNLVSGIGITELKKTIENLSNNREIPYFGITGDDVPASAVAAYGAPEGAIVTAVSMDSPAMAAGVQSGDIIVEFGGIQVGRFTDFIGAMKSMSGGETISLKVYRPVRDSYKELVLEAELGTN